MAGRSLFAGPASDPVSLAEARAHCRIDDTADDGLLAGYVLAARQHLERFTNRAFVTQTWDVTFDDGWPAAGGRSRCIELPLPPLQSVTSITYVDSAGALQTLDPSLYQVVRGHEACGYVVPAYGAAWPAVRRQPDAVTVRFVAGYSATNPFPEPLRLALLLLVGHFYENREAVSVGESFVLPYGVEALALPYRVGGWL